MLMTDLSPTQTGEADAADLVRVGERIEHVAHYTRDEISRFAMLTLDSNPVHHDREAAVAAGMPDVLCLHFNFAYREPIFAESDVTMRWVVSSTEWNTSLDGVIAQLEGKASVANALAVIARGTVLVRRAS